MREGIVHDAERRYAIAREIDAAMARELEFRKKEKEERARHFELKSSEGSHSV